MQISLGQAANYAVFEESGLSGSTVTLTGTSGNPTTINGSVALGAGTNLSVGSNSTIQGTAYYDTGTNLHGYSGSTATAPLAYHRPPRPFPAPLISTIKDLAATPGMPANTMNAGGSLTGATGVTLNVIDLAGEESITNGTFTMNGTANQWFVFGMFAGCHESEKR